MEPEKIKTTNSRRDFIKKSAVGLATFTIVPRYVLGGQGFLAPSDKLTKAGIGVGDHCERRYRICSLSRSDCRIPRSLYYSKTSQHRLVPLERPEALRALEIEVRRMPISSDEEPPLSHGLDEAGGSDGLRYRVELWRAGNYERVLAAAVHAGLALASYDAAVAEFPDGTIILKNGPQTMKRSDRSGNDRAEGQG